MLRIDLFHMVLDADYPKPTAVVGPRSEAIAQVGRKLLGGKPVAKLMGIEQRPCDRHLAGLNFEA